MVKKIDTNIDTEALKYKVGIKAFCDATLQTYRKTYYCPQCGSGRGPNHTPAFKIYEDKDCFKCHKCQAKGDIFSLAGILLRDDNFVEQARYICECMKLDPADFGIYSTGDTQKQAKPSLPSHKTPTTPQKAVPLESDHTKAREAAIGRLRVWQSQIDTPEAVAYLESRGFTLEQAKKWGLGYATDYNGYSSGKRLVIPYPGAEWYTTARDITGQHKARYMQPKADYGLGTPPLFNERAMEQGYFFITEGELDALAVMESSGRPAMALRGTGNAQQAIARLAEAAAARPNTGCTILLLDNDKDGNETTEKLKSELEAKQVKHFAPGELMRAEAFGEAKDANEAWKNNPEALSQQLGILIDFAADEIKKAREEQYKKLLERASVVDPANVAESIMERRDPWGKVPTGLENLDEALGGGLPDRGLVVLAAVSSAGKTTLLVQIADNVAISGRDVLFCTIEQSAQELVAKSLARYTPKYSYYEKSGLPVIVTSEEILDNDTREEWGSDKEASLEKAAEWYRKSVALRLRYMEPKRRPTVEEICSLAKHMAAHSKEGKAPIVFVDYLQLLQPSDPRATDKQAIDTAVTELRQLARDLKTTVVVISSMNRASYSTGVTMESLKESGGIEYGADIVLGLQPGQLRRELDAWRKGGKSKEEIGKAVIEDYKYGSDPRFAEILILKNRNGRLKRDKIYLEMYGARATFKPWPKGKDLPHLEREALEVDWDDDED